MAILQATVTAASPESAEIEGTALIGLINDAIATAQGPRGATVIAMGAFQVIRSPGSLGSFEVHLEAGIRKQDGTVTFGAAITVDEEELNRPFTVEVCPGYVYRIRHVSGADMIGLIN